MNTECGVPDINAFSDFDLHETVRGINPKFPNFEKVMLDYSQMFGEIIVDNNRTNTTQACVILSDWLKANNRERWVEDMACQIIVNNLNIIKTIIYDPEIPIDDVGPLLELMDIYSVSAYFQDKKYWESADEAGIWLDEIIPKRNESISELGNFIHYRLIDIFDRHGDNEQKKEIETWLFDKFDNVGNFNNVSDMDKEQMILASLLNLPISQAMEKHLEKYLSNKGIEYYKVFDYWYMPAFNNDSDRFYIGNYILMNIINIRDVERIKIGGAKMLFDRNGIVHFGRWPIEMLQEQLEEKPDDPRQVAFLSAAVHDHNGSGRNSASYFHEFHESFGDVFRPVIVEIEPVGSLLHRDTHNLSQFEIFDRRASNTLSEETIGFVYMFVHSNHNRFGYGPGKRGDIRADDFVNNHLGTMLPRVNPETLIVLAACSTGSLEPGGIGRWLSLTCDTRVMGVDRPGSYAKLTFELKDGRLEPSIVDARDRSLSIKVNMFKNGEVIQTFGENEDINNLD